MRWTKGRGGGRVAEMNTHTVTAHAIGARYALLRLAYPKDDRNELMITAWVQVLGREPRFPSDVDEGLATAEEMYADADAIDTAFEASGEAV